MKIVDTCATTTTETKVVKLRAKPKIIGIRALKPTCSAMRSPKSEW